MDACQYSNQLGPYLDGELDAGRRGALEAHLRDCADCEAELSELRGLSRLFAAASGPLLSSTAMGQFHRAIFELEDDREQADRAAWRILRITRVLTGIAACLLVAGSLWLSRSSKQSPGDAPSKVTSEVAQAPWDEAVQSTPETAQPADSTAPADATGDWMIGGLVSSAQLPGPGSDQDEQP